MRRLLLCLMIGLFLAGLMGTTAYAQEREMPGRINLMLDGMVLDFDPAPVIHDAFTMLPFRRVAEALNVEVRWDEVNRTIVAEKEGISVVMPVDKPYAYVNNRLVLLEVSPLLLEGRTLIPVRFFTEAFGCKVDWIPASLTVKISSPAQKMQVVAFYALGDEKTSSWTDLFGRPYPESESGNTGIVSDLALGWYSMDEEGNLLTQSATGWQRPNGWEAVVDAARQYKIYTEMVIHMTDGESRLSSFLNNPKAGEKAITAIIKEARFYNGVNLDWEGLGWNEDSQQLAQTREALNNFVKRLSRELKAAGLTLTLTLHPLNSAYLGYDYQTLGQEADRIVIMAYDYGSKPEPITLVKQAVEMAAVVVPTDKLLLGIATLGENPESLESKIGQAKKYKLGGIALWRLGLLSSEKWDVLGDNVIK